MWSDSLINETKKAFNDIENSVLKDLPIICMKSFHGSFGLIFKNDIIKNNYIIIDRETQTKIIYNTLDEMIEAGWVVD